MKFEISHEDFEVVMRSALKHTGTIRLASEALYSKIKDDDEYYLYRDMLPLLEGAFDAYKGNQWIRSGELFLEVWRYTERIFNEDTYYSLTCGDALEELGFLDRNLKITSRLRSLPILPILGVCAMVDAAICYLLEPSTSSPGTGSILGHHNSPVKLLLQESYLFDHVPMPIGKSVYEVLRLCDKIGMLTNDKLRPCRYTARSLAEYATARLITFEKMGCMSAFDEKLWASQSQIIKPNLAWILVVTDIVSGGHLLSDRKKFIPVLEMASGESSRSLWPNLCIKDTLDIYKSSVSQEEEGLA
ncbi:hypothetical protein V490_09000 [Pseudogymnoascus sp. VKM F-3557]|nr:hypothetical protein V490_09000 [Pseudogymnoascus sp. VKM F-3557]